MDRAVENQKHLISGKMPIRHNRLRYAAMALFCLLVTQAFLTIRARTAKSAGDDQREISAGRALELVVSRLKEQYSIEDSECRFVVSRSKSSWVVTIQPLPATPGAMYISWVEAGEKVTIQELY